MKPNPNIKSAHEFIDGAIAFIAEAVTSRGDAITCRKGCCACCEELVIAERGEVERALAGLTQRQREEVAEATRRWVALVMDSPLLEVERPNAIEWRRLRAPCPFLKHKLCMVYDRRPFSCRVFTSVSPLEMCENLDKRPRLKLPESPEALEIAGAIMLTGATRIEYDHLGLLLAEILLNITTIRSAARVVVEGEELQRAQQHAETFFEKHSQKQPQPK